MSLSKDWSQGMVRVTKKAQLQHTSAKFQTVGSPALACALASKMGSVARQVSSDLLRLRLVPPIDGTRGSENGSAAACICISLSMIQQVVCGSVIKQKEERGPGRGCSGGKS